MEKKLRIKLEDELKELRAQQQGEEQGAQRRFPHGSETLEELRRKFAEAEEKVRVFLFTQYVPQMSEVYRPLYNVKNVQM